MTGQSGGMQDKTEDVLNSVRIRLMCKHGERVMAVVVVGWFRASGCLRQAPL